MSEEKAPYGNPSRNSKNQEEPRSENSNYGEFAIIKTECLCENHSELKSVAEEMAETMKETIIDLKILKGNIIMESEVNQRFSDYDKMIQKWIDRNESALEKFNKLKE